MAAVETDLYVGLLAIGVEGEEAPKLADNALRASDSLLSDPAGHAEPGSPSCSAIVRASCCCWSRVSKVRFKRFNPSSNSVCQRHLTHVCVSAPLSRWP